MSEKDVNVRFGADTAELKSGLGALKGELSGVFGSIRSAMDGMASQSKEAMAQVGESFKGLHGIAESLGSAFEGLASHIGLIGKVMAGGAMFKEAVGAVSAEAGEVKRLANIFGITSEAANKLHIQLGLAGVGTDEYVGAAMKLDRQLKVNEKGLNQVGVVTRDANGALLAQADLLKNAVDAMMEYKAGTDRNSFAMLAFGKSAEEAYALLKLNNQSQQEATRLAAAGIGVDQEALDAVKAFNSAKRESGLILEDFISKVGEAVIPIFTSLAKAVSNLALTVFPYFNAAVKAVGSVLSAVGDVITEVVNDVISIFKELEAVEDMVFQSLFGNVDHFTMLTRTIVTTVQVLKVAIMETMQTVTMAVDLAIVAFKTLANVALHAMKLDWNGAKEAAAAGGREMESTMMEHAKNMVKIAEDAASKVAAAWGMKDEKKPKPDKGHKDFHEPKPVTEKSAMPDMEKELNQQKADYAEMEREQGSFIAFSKQQELAFWQSKLNTVANGSEDYKSIMNKINEARYAIDEKAFAASIAKLKEQIVAEKDNYDKQIALAKEAQARIAHAYGADSSKAQEATTKVVELEQKKAEAAKKSALEMITAHQKASLAEINMAEQAAERQLILGEITAQQKIVMDMKFAAQRMAIEQDAASASMALNKVGTADWVKEMQKREEAWATYQKTIGNLQNQSAKELISQWKGVTDSMTSSLGTALDSILMKQSSLGKAFQKMCQQMVADMVKAGAEQVAKWAVFEMSKTAATVTGNAARTAADAGGASAAAALNIAAVIKSIMASAGETFAGIFGFLSPKMGPGAAVPAAAGAAAVKAVIPSSAGGEWNVPSDRLNFVHKNETIMPARVAAPMREFFEGGGNGGGSPNIHIHATDSQDVARLFKNNGQALARAAKEAMRNFRK